MPAVKLREDFSADELRALARRAKDFNQSRRLLSLAAVRDGKDRGEAARIGSMDRQTPRDWLHRFNAAGPEGLFDHWTEGPKPRLSAEQLAAFAKIAETEPDREKDGVVRWRRVDLNRVIRREIRSRFSRALRRDAVEEAIRPIALNRKNALFAGSDGGAENWAVVASLIETCKLNGVDPQAYMDDVLTKIVNGHLASKLDDLMPWAYAQPIVLKDAV